MNYKKTLSIMLLLLMAPVFALTCAPATPVCTTTGTTYANQTTAEAAGKVVAYCSACSTSQSPCTNNGTISQYGGNSSFIERYTMCSANQLIGNSSAGPNLMGLLIGIIMTMFVMMQNTRFDGKILGLLVTGVVVSVFAGGWVIWIVSLAIGVILYFGLWQRIIGG